MLCLNDVRRPACSLKNHYHGMFRHGSAKNRVKMGQGHKIYQHKDSHFVYMLGQPVVSKKTLSGVYHLVGRKLAHNLCEKNARKKKNVPMMLRTRLAKTKSQHANEQNCQMPNSTKIVLRHCS